MNDIKETKIADGISLYSNVFIEHEKVMDTIENIKNQIWIHNDIESDAIKFNVFSYASCYIGTKINNNIGDLSLLERRMYFSFTKFINKYAETYGLNYGGIIKTFFLKYVEGDFDIPHHESINGEVCVSVYYFINDDYEGGEIYFPNQDIEVKGKANELLIVKSTKDFIHFSKPVTSGTKYIYNIVVE